MLQKLALVFAVISVSACATRASLPEVEGYQMLTMPSSNYQVGDLVAIYSSPPKEDVIFATKIPGEKIRESDGPVIGSVSNTSAGARLEARLETTLSGEASGQTVRISDVRFENTRVRTAEVAGLSQHIIDQLSNEPGKRADILFRTRNSCFLFIFCKQRTRMDVLTELLIADVEYVFETGSNVTAEASAERLATQLGGGVEVDTSSTTSVTANSVVVGYRKDPIGAERVIEELRRSE